MCEPRRRRSELWIEKRQTVAFGEGGGRHLAGQHLATILAVFHQMWPKFMKSQTLYQSSGYGSAWTKRGRAFTRTAWRRSSLISKATSISANSPYFGGIRDGVASTYPESLLIVNGRVLHSLLVAALLYWPFDMRVANHHWRSKTRRNDVPAPESRLSRSVQASEVPIVRIASRRCYVY